MYGDGGDAMMQVLSRVRQRWNVLHTLQLTAMHHICMSTKHHIMHVMTQRCVSQCHANFTENAPLYVALSGLAELSGRGSPSLLHVRVAHIGVRVTLFCSTPTASAQSQCHCVVMM